MNRITLIFLLLTFTLCLIQPIQAQNSDEQRAMLLKEIEAATKYNDEIIAQMMQIRARIAALQLAKNAEMDKKIVQAIKDNDLATAEKYFDAYCNTLDSLVVYNPAMAQKTVAKLKTLFKDVPSVWDRIYYYSGAADYFLLSYNQAEKNLRSMIELYPESLKRNTAMSLLLKTYILSNNEQKAVPIIELNKRYFDDTSNYLAGHIYFSLEQDSISADFFSKVKDNKYSKDTQKMLSLIATFNQNSQTAYDQFVTMLAADPNNPFVLLSLARLSTMNGNWSDAEKYYSQYNQASKKQNEIVSQYELALAYLNTGDTAKTLQILTTLLQNKNIGEFYSPTLYLWSEITTNNGDIAQVNLNQEQIMSQINFNFNILPQKAALMDKIVALKSNLTENSDIESIQGTIDEINSINTELETLNKTLATNPTGITPVQLKRWELYEKQLSISYLDMLNQFIGAHRLRDFPDSTHIKQLGSIETSLNQQISTIDNMRRILEQQASENMALAFKNELEQTVDMCSSMLLGLNQLKTRGKGSYTPAQYDSLIVFYERKKAEANLQLVYYDYDNTMYKNLMEETEAGKRDTAKLLESIPSIKEKYRVEYPLHISRVEKTAVLKDLNKMVTVSADYNASLADQQTHLTQLKTDIEFIGLHIAYTETGFFEKQRLNRNATLTLEESTVLFNENRTRKQAALDKILVFMSKNPDYKSISIPKDYPAFISDATLYYELAELSYSLQQDKPEIALDYFRKANNLDAKFYNRDAVLYNIGVLAGQLTQNRIENGLVNFESTTTASAIKPNNLRYSESTYGESIDSYNQLISEYKDSPYYPEALLRLGFVYFEIGTDADVPVNYYAKARAYYDQILDNQTLVKENDPIRFQALYQRGWTLLNSSKNEDYVKAMTDFVSILNFIDQGVIADSTEVINYTLAAIKNIGFCLIGLDSSNTSLVSEGAKYAQLTLAPLVNTTNRNKIIDEAIAQKRRLLMHMQEVDFMQVKIALDPLALINPVTADSICNIYSAYPQEIRSNMAPIDFVRAEQIKLAMTYGPNSEWYNVNKANIPAKQIAVLRNAFNVAEMRYTNQFIDNPTQANFDQYTAIVDQYKAYTAIHDEQFNQWDVAKQANIVGLSSTLAVRSNSPVSYLQTVKRIYAYNDSYNDNKDFYSNENTAFRYTKLVVDSLSSQLVALQQQNPVINLPATQDSLTAFYAAASERFKSVLLSDRFKSPDNDKQFIIIVLDEAVTARANNDNEKAARLYTSLIDFKGDVSKEILRSSYMNLAQIAEVNKNYAEAETRYLGAEAYAADDADKAIIHSYALVQIQSKIEDAQGKGDNATVALENLRLGKEFAEKDPEKQLGYKLQAQLAYLDAKEYQKSIDLLLDMSKSKSKPSDVLKFYGRAWVLADSVGYKSQSDSLKQDFIAKFPSSNESYLLRTTIINTIAENPATLAQAGAMRMDIYQDVVANRIDAGDEDPQEIFLMAIESYAKASDLVKTQELSEQFIATYPANPKTVILMDQLAETYMAKGDTLKYEQMAYNLFKKDKTRAARYENIAKAKLGKVNTAFLKAYDEKDWTLAFAKRDEFKSIQATYENEGVKLPFDAIYAEFKQAELDYAEIQAKIAFFKKYDIDLAAFEYGLMAKRPADLIKINVNTKWEGNLRGGKDKRIQTFRNMVVAETGKVEKLLKSASKYDLDTERKLRAYDMICRINEFGVDVIHKQIEQWMRTSSEYNNRYKPAFVGEEAQAELVAKFNEFMDEDSAPLLNHAGIYYSLMYRYFYIPGCRDKYTQNAYAKMKDMGLLPRYRLDELNLSTGWNMALVDVAEATNVSEIDFNTGLTSTSIGNKLSTLNIPANKGLILRRTVNSKVAPEYMIANVVSPYLQDSIIKVNDESVNIVSAAIDTLEIGKPSTTRYALGFNFGKFTQKDNLVEMRFFNYGTDPLPFAMNLMVISDSAKIEAAVPQETVKIPSDEYWQYAVSDSTGALNWKFTTVTNNFGFEQSQWVDMETSSAKPIWVATEDRQDSLKVVFKKDFMFNGVLKDGFITFVAPDVATLKINGKEIYADYLLNYDAETNLVYAGKAYLSAEFMKQGVNNLEIVVTNKSQWKGMVAEINMTIAHPE